MVEKVVEKDKFGREQCSLIQFWNTLLHKHTSH